jgi:FMN phosphatase YigB (HAD superfamily)
MKITTVFLDAGGVILDEAEHEDAVADVAVEVLSGIVDGYSLDAYWRDVEEASCVYAPRIYQYVFYKHLKHGPASFDTIYDSFISKWRERRPPLKLTPGLAVEVESLSRDFDLGILGQYGREVVDLLSEHALLGFFEHTFTQDDFTLTKPDPRYYEQVAKGCGVDPCECIMVGDRLDKDVVPARQVGMKTIRIRVGILRGQEPRIPFEVPDVELPGIAGLAEAARGLAAGR